MNLNTYCMTCFFQIWCAEPDPHAFLIEFALHMLSQMNLKYHRSFNMLLESQGKRALPSTVLTAALSSEQVPSTLSSKQTFLKKYLLWHLRLAMSTPLVPCQSFSCNWLPENFSKASWQPSESFLGASRESPESVLRVSWESPEFSWESSESFMIGSWELPEKLPDNLTGVSWEPPENSLKASWVPWEPSESFLILIVNHRWHTYDIVRLLHILSRQAWVPPRQCFGFNANFWKPESRRILEHRSYSFRGEHAFDHSHWVLTWAVEIKRIKWSKWVK